MRKTKSFSNLYNPLSNSLNILKSDIQNKISKNLKPKFMLKNDNLNKSYIKKEKTNNKNGLNSKRMEPILVKSSKNSISKNSKRNNNDLNKQYFHETNIENTKIGKYKKLTLNLKRRNDEKSKSIKEYNQKENKTINVEDKKKSKLSLNNKKKKELN